MNNKIQSLFNLIEIFRQGKKATPKIDEQAYCSHEGLHDLYCDVEKHAVKA